MAYLREKKSTGGFLELSAENDACFSRLLTFMGEIWDKDSKIIKRAFKDWRTKTGSRSQRALNFGGKNGEGQKNISQTPSLSLTKSKIKSTLKLQN